MMKSAISLLETQIEGVFKSAPELSKDAKKSLVNAWPVIALVFGVLQLLAAWGLMSAMRAVERLNTAFSAIYSYAGYSSSERMLVYLGILVLLVDAVILLMAYPELKKRTKRGWDLLFLGSLVNVAYAVLSLFLRGGGITSFIFSMLGSGLGFYLLFQVKSMYKKSSSSNTDS